MSAVPTKGHPSSIRGFLQMWTHRDPARRIYILGVGNLGILLATSIASLPDAPPITLVFHRKELLRSWSRKPGIEISRGGIVQRQAGFDVELWSEELPPSGEQREIAGGRSIRNLIVTTKASQALPEVDRVRRYLDGSSTIAFVQNGMCKMWPPHGDMYVKSRYTHSQTSSHPNWLACVTTHGVTSTGRFKSTHASQADIKVGPVLSSTTAPNNASFLSEILTNAPHLNGAAVTRGELWVLQLEKLVVNSIINPLTAILRCKNGDIFFKSTERMSQVIDMLLQEASRVLQALIQDASAESIIQSSAESEGLSKTIHLSRRALLDRFSQSSLRHMLYDVGYKVRDNTSSMLQDVQSGKQTEIDDFNGWLVDIAGYLGGELDVSTHEILIDLVKRGISLDMGSLGKHLCP
ncbi:Ketoisovalerate reductase BEA2 [Colletotrichum trifolii]|uniref:Ketoisovalerate reductase BEA2 n=1 Tax=Colletotrichum trifolii TaxID=5466 RepID=A0A4R8RKX8_COLTR|nr:Ketoisovalerate reductase BEA2 [Colletotrichum trifolii]